MTGTNVVCLFFVLIPSDWLCVLSFRRVSLRRIYQLEIGKIDPYKLEICKLYIDNYNSNVNVGELKIDNDGDNNVCKLKIDNFSKKTV